MKFKMFSSIQIVLLAICMVFVFSCSSANKGIPVSQNDHIVLIGNNLGARMLDYDYFETELHLRYPDSNLYVRNLCDPGNTPGFRASAGRKDPWAFPGAEKFYTELANNTHSEGFFESPDEWLTRHKADIIVAFFGYNESFRGEDGIENYKAELEAFIKHTNTQTYNGNTAPTLVLVSPIAFENLSAKRDLPDGKQENINLELYTAAMKEVAAANNTYFVDVFTPTKKWFNAAKEPLTIDGFQLTEEGYQKFGKLLADEIFGSKKANTLHQQMVFDAVKEKNWMWKMDYRIPNGVHVYGRRYKPFGPDNYPDELIKVRQLTVIRDSAIWLASSKGELFNLAEADKHTHALPEVQTNYNPDRNGSLKYLYGEEAIKSFTLPKGYKIELFASEEQFPDLANPMQMSFDNKGRLWIATMPTYPHYRPGDAKPNDKIIIFEDTDGDGKADKQTVFADSLHLPIGFEIAPEGVYVSQGTNLQLFEDTDGDGKVDKKTLLLSGFDDHDTHHAISAFAADESGAIYMAEGVFLHTNVETAYGPVYASNGGFYRYNPARNHLERTAQVSVPNPWGIIFDNWGQHFYAETSGPDVRWMLPGSILPRYGEGNPKGFTLVEDAHKVRPTSGLEFISSRHFPDDVQGDLLINNTIGFLGTKQHVLEDHHAGYSTRFRQDLLVSSDRNFRPVDMEIAPDGSLYVVDWHNILIGHMQHNARDPLRDHVHGRIYRITYPERPLVTPAKIDGASIDELLENLKLPEYRSRYRTRRELRGRNHDEVNTKLTAWINNLDKNDAKYEHHLLEALWVSWGLNKVNQEVLKQVLKAKDFHARAAAVRVLHYSGHQVKDQAALLKEAAADAHGRVRLEAIVAASWLPRETGLEILDEAKKHELDEWMLPTFEAAVAHISGTSVKEQTADAGSSNLRGRELEQYNMGRAIYGKEGYCATCHQPDGKGLTASGFPPLAGTEWVLGNEERLIKLVLKGLMGPMEVNGVKYPGQVPMTPFEGMLNDNEVAAVLTYVRNAFGNKASAISADQVKKVRAAVAGKKDFYTVEGLLKEHPLPK